MSLHRPPIPALMLLIILAGGCAARASRPPAGPDVPAPAGIHHPLERGQTLYALSRAYGVSVERLMTVNGIVDPTSIPAGTPIFVPGATRVLPLVAAPALLAWPVEGNITSRFGRRGRGDRHSGIDIDSEEGATIRAASAGRVVQAGRDGDYGLRVILDHGDGLTTLYAHASSLAVKRGDVVAAGDPIARVGRTGNARGTHLHFEVRRGARAVDPIPYLSGTPALRASGQ